MIYIMLDKGLQEIKDRAFKDGEDYSTTYDQLMVGVEMLRGQNNNTREKRLSTWAGIEHAYSKIKRIEEKYSLSSGVDRLREILSKDHEELCYQDIEEMRKSGELTRLGINWPAEQK